MNCKCCNNDSLIYITKFNLTRCKRCGHFEQKEKEPYSYDKAYIDKAYLLSPNVEMSFIRLSLLKHYFPRAKSVLDVGAGYGEFVRQAQRVGLNAYGYDILTENIYNNYPMGDFFAPYDVLTFFDSLEHFSDFDFLNHIKSNKIIVSAPYTALHEDFDFNKWKHYKPDEHLHYFTKKSIEYLFSKHDFYLVDTSRAETLIRKDVLTYIFERFDKGGEND